MSNKSYLVIAGVTTLCLGMSGCETTDRLRIDDGHAPQMSSAIIIHPADWRFGRNDRIQGGVEIGYERQLTDNFQRLDPSHQLVIQTSPNEVLVDNTFSGPQTVHHRARFEHGHVMYKPLLSFGRHFQIEPGLGLSYDEITVATTGQRTLPTAGPATVEKIIEAWSASASVTPRFKFDEIMAIEARARLSFGQRRDNASGGFALVITPVKQLEISGGYMWREQEIETAFATSNIHVETRGPTVGVRFVF